MIAILVALHGAFFAVFMLRLLGLVRPRESAASRAALAASQVHLSPHADALLVAHGGGFAVFYWGLLSALEGNGFPAVGALRPLLATAAIVLALGLLIWTLLVFRSWRLLAELERGHELCTEGPFRFVRHPIYLACDLLALGTAIWVTTPLVAVGTALIFVGGDLRARAEERILLAAFGERYRDYIDRTHRLIPWLY